jgi:hypothetical protein
MDSSQSQAILDSLAALSRQAEKQAEIFTAQLSQQAAQVSELTEKISEQQVAIDMAQNATPAPKVKKEPKDHSIAQMKLGFGGSQVSAHSNVSEGSADVQFLRTMINPNYGDAATLSKTKQEQYMLAKIQSEYKAKIPVLSYTAPTDAVSAVSNYHEWRQCLLQYYTVLSPVLAERTKLFLDGIDIDKFLDGNSTNVVYPVIDDADYPNLTKLMAKSAITSTIPTALKYLVEQETMTDIFPSLKNLHCVLQPNSVEQRTSQLIKFWDSKMLSADTISIFGGRLQQLFDQHNAATITEKIPQSQLLAAFKNGVATGAHSLRYKEALKVMKYRSQQMDFQNSVIWLETNADTTQPLTPTPADQQASAARTNSQHGPGGERGYQRGKGGKGRGGKGGKGGKGRKAGKNADPAPNPPIAGSPTYNQTYYKVEDADGNEIITKEVSDRRGAQPCFTKFQEGKCDREDCLYSHDFNLESRPERARGRPDKDPAASNVKFDYDKFEAKASSLNGTAEDDDDFDYVHDLGFNHSAACAKSSAQTWAKAEQEELASLEGKFKPTASISHDACIVFLTLLTTGIIYLVFPLLAPFFSGVFDVCIKTTTAFLGSPESFLFLLVTVASFLTVFFNTATVFFNTTTVLCAQFSSAVRWMGSFHATYQVILDGGCTFTMSGDKGLFVPSSLSPIDENVGLAESGLKVKATHYGKISVGGQLIDALYVPDFRQTMISMGQLEKMGLRYTVIGNIRNFLTPNNSVFLSFTLAANNLYILSSSVCSNSASSA